MKPIFLRSSSLAALLFALAFTASTVRAQLLSYDIHLNTSSLVGSPAGPFFLDFQFNEGGASPDNDNTVTLSNFTFGGGAAAGLPTLFGGASGNASSTVTLKDTAAFNEFIQGFTPGSSLGFRLTLTTHADVPPDEFVFALLDATWSNLPTQNAALDAIIVADITGNKLSVQSFAGDPSIAPNAGGPGIAFAAPSVVPVPEPAAYSLVGGAALIGLAVMRRRRSTAA